MQTHSCEINFLVIILKQFKRSCTNITVFTLLTCSRLSNGRLILNLIIYVYDFYKSVSRVRNEEVRRRADIDRELASRADRRVLRWFGHVERDWTVWLGGC